MPKQINVKLGFQADTAQAKKQIQDLQHSLDDLMSSSIKNSATGGFNQQISNAQQSILKLKTALNSSLNMDTGRLDLSKFNQQLNNSDLSLSKLAKDMSAMGTDGQKAFLNLANSIVSAQKPMVESNKLLDGMWTALKNTARWQLSSSILHGFVGALQGAYGYAQDLDKSLNSIRIVSGQSAEQMAQFAEQANKSAQALSTSTLAYTDAALIFYQQGLRGEEVNERVDTVLKLSNVTGESAEDVSSYMTAIWNNFDDGSISLEQYADKITALGAATASSSAEIANGMQQFAAVAKTVGLSYDYAASALATVVAQTRQSESTVGNAFRTIFSRLESVKLGDTLEDGVGLTKYTEALAKAGVQVLDQNGQLKDMDTILSNIGEKWQQLGKTQQVALAQTVGGVRQYANLIALFDNWDKFQENLAVSQGAEGTLQEQADIYAESWEAARKRVQAAWQSIYQDLINDKFFIGMLDNVGKVINGIDKLIDSIGGLPGVLGAVGAVVTKVFEKQLVGGLENTQLQLSKIMKPLGSKKTYAEINADQMADQALYEAIKQRQETKGGAFGAGQDVVLENLYKQVELNKQLRSLDIDRNSEEYKNYQNLIKITEEYSKQIQQLSELSEKASKQKILNTQSLLGASDDSRLRDLLGFNSEEGKKLDIALNSLAKNFNAEDLDLGVAVESLSKRYFDFAKDIGISESAIKKWINAEIEARAASEKLNNTIDAQEKKFKELAEASDGKLAVTDRQAKFSAQQEKDIEEYQNQIKSLTLQNGQITKLKNKIENTLESDFQSKGLYLDSKDGSGLIKDLEQLKTWAEEIEAKKQELQEKIREIQNNPEDVPSLPAPEEPKKMPFYLRPEFAQGVTSAFKGLSQLTMGINAVSSALEILNNKDLGVFERLKRALPALLMGLPMLVTGINAVGTSFVWLTGKEYAATVASKGLIGAAGGLKAAFIEIYLPILAITAAIGAVVWAIKAANDEFNKDAIAAEKAAEAAEEAKTAYDEVTNSFKDLKSELENHQAARNALDDLKQGTEEWHNAVKNLNEDVLELLTKYPELAKFVENINGSLQLTDEGMQKYLDEQYREQQRSYLDYINKQTDWYQKNSTSAMTDASRKITYGAPGRYDSNEGVTAQSANNQEMRAAIAAFEKDSEAFLKAGEDIAKYTDDFAQLLNEQGITNTDLIQAFWNNRNAIAQLSQEIQSNTSASNALTDVFYQAGIENEMGSAIEATVGDNTYLITPIEEFLSQQVQRTQDRLEQEGLESAEAYFQALQEVKDNYIENFESINAQADRRAGIGIADSLNANGAHLDQSEWNDFWGGLESEDKKILLSIGIDKEKSIADCEDAIKEEKERLQKILDDTPIEFNTDGLSKKQAAEVQEEFVNLTNYIYENAESIKELDNHLAECRRESSRVAAAIIKFDDAIQDVTDNYEDWNKALTSGSMQRATKAANDMRKSYANLLDIDGTVLSSQFLQNADNLDLMKQAIEGNEDAYSKLQQKANEDIVAHLTLIDDDFYDRAEALRNFVNSEEFGKLKIGAELNDEGFLNELTNLVNAAHMTQEQATAYLANMGIDAEIEEHKAEATDEKTVAGFTPTITDVSKEGSTTTVDSEGNTKSEPFTTVVHGVTYERNETVLTEPKEETGFTLKVKSAHKSSGGGFKFKQASHGGGGAGNGGGSGKKGGGGGGGSAKKKEVKEHVKDEDRYHDIKERIDDLNKSTDRLSKTKDRVYGKSKLKYINDEIEALEKQVKLTDEYIAEIKKYLALDLGNLKGIGMGAVFDENGMLTNYEQVLANITATYNKAIDVYNASAQEEADKEILEKAQKTYEENKKILKQYEDTYNLLQEEVDKRIDQINAIYDAKLAKIDWQVKLQLDFDDKDRELLQWIFDNMGDGADRAADRIANLNKQMETFEQDWETYRNGIKEIFSQHGIDLDFDNLNADQLVLQLQEYMRNEQLASELTEKEAEQLREYLSGLMTTYTSMKDTANEVHEILTDTISAMAEEFEKGNKKIEQAGNIMKHYANIVDLTGRKLLKLSSSELRKMSQQIVNNAKDALGAAKMEMDEWRAQMEEAQMLMLKYQLEGDEQSYEYWKEHFEQLEELYTDATENYYSAWENALEAANEAFEKSIDLMREDYENAFGSMDLTWMAEQFKTQQELNELYLPDYKKYHELNASVRKLNKSLQDTNNTLIKGKMNDLLDEINAKMADGVKISEYEAGIIERRIALLQAEAQLRDAQQAKSAVRMTRDNEGNFSYTYTADQDAISNAEENYADAVYDYQEYMVSMSNDLQSKWLEWNQYFADREAEILAKYKEGTEEYNQAMAALTEERAAKLGWLTDQMGVLFDEQKRFRDNDWADIENIVQLKLLSDEDLITSFDRTVLSAITGYDTLTELMDAGEMAWENMLIDAEDALQTWQDNCYLIYEEAGTTVDDFADKTEADMEKVAEDSAKAKEAISDMVNNEENGMKKSLEDAKKAAKDFDDAYGKYMTNIRNATQDTIAILNDMLKKLNETYEKQQQLAAQAASISQGGKSTVSNASAGSGSSGSGSGGGGSGGTGGSYSGGGGSQRYKTGTYYKLDESGRYATKAKAKEAGAGKYGTHKIRQIDTYSAAPLEVDRGIVETFSVVGSGGGSGRNTQMYMSTGGYTGDWVTDVGRLAVLHKKELVLNKDDTANMLKTVDLVREMMTQTIGTQSLFKNNINYTGVNAIGSIGRELQQSVHIDASFPNVQSHTEIELALNNLINSATQYVNRK